MSNEVTCRVVENAITWTEVLQGLAIATGVIVLVIVAVAAFHWVADR